jgi:succinate dehydrogenase / fumarate reductase cytochrome b subunit
VAIHLMVNATIVQGGDIYQKQVDKIHALPFLVGVEWLLIYIPIIYHTIYCAWIIVTGQPNVGDYPYLKNVFYLMQRISAVILAAFICYHIFAMHGLFGPAFDPTRATATVIANINPHWTLKYLVYPIGILAACFHTANGFWAAGVSWGLTTSSGGQRHWGRVCLLIFIATTAAGLVALGATIAGGHGAAS